MRPQPFLQRGDGQVNNNPAPDVCAIQKISNGVLVTYEVARAVTVPKNWQPPGTLPIPRSFQPIMTQLLRRQMEKLEEGEGWKGEEPIGVLLDRMDAEMKELFVKPQVVSLVYYSVEQITVFCGLGGADLPTVIATATEQCKLIEQYRTEGKLLNYQPDQVSLLSPAADGRYAVAR